MQVWRRQKCCRVVSHCYLNQIQYKTKSRIMILGTPVVSVIIKVPVFVAVLISNTFVVSIWMSPKVRSPITVVLSTIAVCDLLTFCCGTIFTVSDYFGGKTLIPAYCYLTRISMELAYIWHSMSILSTTFLAVQRCVVCAFPFAGPRMCGMKSTKIFAIAFFIVALIPALPDLMIRNIEHFEITTTENITALKCKTNYVLGENSMSKIYIVYYQYGLFVLSLAPAIIITFCIVVILITINRRKLVTGHSSDQRSKTRTTTMLLMIMFIFVVGEFPGTLYSVYASFFPNTYTWLRSTMGIWFLNMFMAVSYLVNVWVYIAMSKPFRERFFELLCRFNIKQITNTNQTSSTPRV